MSPEHRWMQVGKAFQDGHSACNDCGYCRTFEGAPGEVLRECRLGKSRNDSPDDCPAIALTLEQKLDRLEQALGQIVEEDPQGYFAAIANEALREVAA